MDVNRKNQKGLLLPPVCNENRVSETNETSSVCYSRSVATSEFLLPGNNTVNAESWQLVELARGYMRALVTAIMKMPTHIARRNQ